MSQPVISVEQLSKAYRIGLKEEIPDTLVSALTGFVKAPLRNFRRLHRLDTSRNAAGDEDTFWALRDVSFEVQEGEVLGVIGRNGAGKSTLLKILSRITEPTSGRAVIRGRISSLLEVGTGFHPELSGRENVYLNGTILGMTKAEIDRKFDEIVNFSGVEKFLDTPVKRYSSGMKVRLAFAVAAHLEPEILIIDEVLAVGDAEFQKKCMGKMQSVARKGRTVLFVSHNMAAVQNLCSKGVLLQGGEIASGGDVAAVVHQYLASGQTPNEAEVKRDPCDSVDADARISRVRITSKSNVTSNCYTIATPLVVDVDFDVRTKVENAILCGHVKTEADTILLSTTEVDGLLDNDIPARIERTPGQYKARLTIPAPLLNEGRYLFEAIIFVPKVRIIDRAPPVSFMIQDPSSSGAKLFHSARRGYVYQPMEWNVHCCSKVIFSGASRE